MLKISKLGALTATVIFSVMTLTTAAIYEVSTNVFSDDECQGFCDDRARSARDEGALAHQSPNQAEPRDGEFNEEEEEEEGEDHEGVLAESARRARDGEGSESCLPSDCEVEAAGEAVAHARPALQPLVQPLLRAASKAAQRGRSRSRSGGGESPRDEPPAREAPEEYAEIEQYLTDIDESPADVQKLVDILAAPSNIAESDGLVSILAWQPRLEEPAGSYLSVVQQDPESKLSQIHRYLCPERRLDTLAESCVPVASVFPNEHQPFSTRYSEDGLPITMEASDLDPSPFSSGSFYVEANEFLIQLQEYFDAMRGDQV